MHLPPFRYMNAPQPCPPCPSLCARLRSSFTTIARLSVPGLAPATPKEVACATVATTAAIPRTALEIKMYLTLIGFAPSFNHAHPDDNLPQFRTRGPPPCGAGRSFADGPAVAASPPANAILRSRQLPSEGSAY